MSLQDYDKNSYSGDELLEENNENVIESEGPGTEDNNALSRFSSNIFLHF